VDRPGVIKHDKLASNKWPLGKRSSTPLTRRIRLPLRDISPRTVSGRNPEPIELDLKQRIGMIKWVCSPAGIDQRQHAGLCNRHCTIAQ